LHFSQNTYARYQSVSLVEVGVKGHVSALRKPPALNKESFNEMVCPCITLRFSSRSSLRSCSPGSGILPEPTGRTIVLQLGEIWHYLRTVCWAIVDSSLFIDQLSHVLSYPRGVHDIGLMIEMRLKDGEGHCPRAPGAIRAFFGHNTS
jgi:hypothetical protein